VARWSPVTDPVTLDGDSLTPAAVARVAREDAPVSVAEPARERVRTARDRVERVVESGETVYGLNTGFGDLVEERVERDESARLQTNLVRSHASGTGRECTREEVRALLVTRVNALLVGNSGVREAVLDRLVALLNEGVHPVVRSRGSLGASGDLAPLAHVALVLVGEGEADVDLAAGPPPADRNAVRNRPEPGDGRRDDERPRTGPTTGTKRLPGDAALEEAGVDPLSFAPKEALALINGTQLSVGLAALAVVDADCLVATADAVGTLTTEVTMGTTAACDPAIHDARPHPGQRVSAANVRRVAAGSDVVESHRNCDRVQDAYSIRCLPQVHGAVRDAVNHLREAVTVELNSATDNPLVFPADAVRDAERASGTGDAAVLSGGNFHGAPLAHRLDYLVGALTDLAAIAERRVDRVLNPNLQETHLPPFLAGESGLESGMMIPQYTAAALVNELRAEGRTATDSTPVSGNQEDHVSMSATGAFAARRAVERARRVVAVELLVAGEALEYVDDDLSPGAGTAALHRTLREWVAPLDGDRPLDRDVDRAAELVADGRVRAAVEAAVDGDLA
jgi:histidine ammonia-lyase